MTFFTHNYVSMNYTTFFVLLSSFPAWVFTYKQLKYYITIYKLFVYLVHKKF